MIGFIDPPSPFDALDKWQDFLKEMQAKLTLHPDDPDVIFEIAAAKAMIAELQD